MAPTEPFLARGASRRANGLLIEAVDLFEAMGALAAAGVGPVSAAKPDYVFEPNSDAADKLQAFVGQ